MLGQCFRAITSLEGVPPIEVFRLGGVYFVVDGNHRVSVARASGFKDIAAFVTDIPVAADLETGDSLDAAIIKAEHARFLVETRLSDRFGDVSDIRFTKPGGYGKLLEHIEGHRYFMGLDHPEMGPVDFAQAAEDWYTRIYRPIVAAIERRRLLQQLPDSTAADLYVCVSAEILAAAQECGQDLTPDEAAAKLEPSASAWSRAIRDIMRMLTEIGDTLTDASAGIPPWAGQTLEWGDFAPPHAPLPTIVTEDRHDE